MGLLYAQDDQKSNNGMSNQNLISPDSTNFKVSTAGNSEVNFYREYQQWNFTKLSSFEEIAIEKGFSATPEEISERSKIFKQLFPGMPVAEHEIRSEIVVQKYLENIYGQNYSIEEIRKVYNEILKKIPETNVPSVEELNPYLKLKVLLSKPAIENELSKINEGIERQTRAHISKKMEIWSVSDLQIDAPENQCIANSDSNGCLLSVKQYNDKVRYQTIFKRTSIDSARVLAATNMLTDLYLVDQARKNGFTDSDSLQKIKDNWIQVSQLLKKNRGLGRTVSDENSLWKAYSDYFDALFRQRQTTFISLIGSSDSLYIDSISAHLKTLDKKTAANPDTNAEIKTIPWKHLVKSDLPNELSIIADTLHEGHASRVIKTKFGYFLLRTDSVQVRHEVQFEDVKEQLGYIATKQKWFNLDSILQEKALTIYKNNKHLSLTPDTIKIITQFYPDFSQLQNNFIDKLLMPDSKNNPELSNSALDINSSLLPVSIQYQLTDSLMNTRWQKNNTYTIHTMFGDWRLKLLAEKNGRLKIPFSHVRKQLIDSLINAEVDSIFNRSLTIDSTFDTVVLARSFMPYFLGLEGAVRNKLMIDADKQVEEGKISSADRNEVLNEYTQNRFQEIDAWISHLSINTDLLRSPNIK